MLRRKVGHDDGERQREGRILWKDKIRRNQGVRFGGTITDDEGTFIGRMNVWASDPSADGRETRSREKTISTSSEIGIRSFRILSAVTDHDPVIRIPALFRLLQACSGTKVTRNPKVRRILSSLPVKFRGWIISSHLIPRELWELESKMARRNFAKERAERA